MYHILFFIAILSFIVSLITLFAAHRSGASAFDEAFTSGLNKAFNLTPTEEDKRIARLYKRHTAILVACLAVILFCLAGMILII